MIWLIASVIHPDRLKGVPKTAPDVFQRLHTNKPRLSFFREPMRLLRSTESCKKIMATGDGQDMLYKIQLTTVSALVYGPFQRGSIMLRCFLAAQDPGVRGFGRMRHAENLKRFKWIPPPNESSHEAWAVAKKWPKKPPSSRAGIVLAALGLSAESPESPGFGTSSTSSI